MLWRASGAARASSLRRDNYGIEIGCVELVNRRLTGRNFHKYINPDREIDDGALEVHGITQEFLSDKPRFADIWDEFKKLFGNNDE